MADQGTASSNANFHLYCRCMADKPPAEPDFSRVVQVPKCLVLEYKGQCVLVARPGMLRPRPSQAGTVVCENLPKYPSS